MPWLTAIPGALRLVPRWVWMLLLAALAWHFALAWHAGQVKAHDAQVIADRDAQWTKRLADERAAALAWKGKFDAEVAAKIKLQRKLNDEENRRIAADAADLRLRGPGQAAAGPGCRPVDHPGLAGFAGGSVAQPGPAAHAGTSVPAENGADQWAVVPWNWLVDVVSERDAFRLEAIAWRSRDAMLAGMWRRMQQEQDRPAAPTKKPDPG